MAMRQATRTAECTGAGVRSRCAAGWLGRTYGVTDDGTLIAAV